MRKLLLLALLAFPATAHAAPTGTVEGAFKPRPRAVRAIAAETGKVVATSEPKGSRYRLKVPAGAYVIAGDGKRTRAVRVKKGRTVKARAAQAPRYVLGVDPSVKVTGVPGYPAGLDVDSLIVTDLFESTCASGGPSWQLVEVRYRKALEREIERSHSRAFDPRTAIPRGHLISPQQLVKGGGTVAGGRASLQLHVVDVASGQDIAGAAVEGPAANLLGLIDQLTAQLRDDLCAGRVDVTFTGSGSYVRDEGAPSENTEHHVKASYRWSITYRDVKLGVPDGTPFFAAVGEASGEWSDDGRFGVEGPGSWHCGGPVIGYTPEFATLQVSRTATGHRLVVKPFFHIQGDVAAIACTGLSGTPYALFQMPGVEAATGAVVDVDAARLGTTAVAPTQPVAADCSGLLTSHEPICSQSLSWSGQVTVTR